MPQTSFYCPADGEDEEVFLLEFQGKFTGLDQKGSDSLVKLSELMQQGLDMSAKESIIFTVGSYQVKGRLQKLPKPLLVLKRKSREEDLQAISVIRQKIVFAERPVLIMQPSFKEKRIKQ